MNTKWETYKALELIPDSVPTPGHTIASWQISQARTTIAQQIKTLIVTLLTEPQEPRIRRVVDREGHAWWRVYNPLTHQTVDLESEEEVYVWLDQQWY